MLMAKSRERNGMLACQWAVAALGMILLSGCGSRPRAPALSDEPVYQNDREGFRFRVPEGWTQQARADLPAGPVKKEHLLVRYMHTGPGKRAVLEVSLADLPESTELSTYLAGPSYGTKQWRRTAPVGSLEGKGPSAVRLIFMANVGEAEMTKEVVAYRRGGRVYLFTGLFAAGDSKAREEIRRAVDSTDWKS
jgi:hypothetical protein